MARAWGPRGPGEARDFRIIGFKAKALGFRVYRV